jgi:hypothetical protein
MSDPLDQLPTKIANLFYNVGLLPYRVNMTTGIRAFFVVSMTLNEQLRFCVGWATGSLCCAILRDKVVGRLWMGWLAGVMLGVSETKTAQS